MAGAAAAGSGSVAAGGAPGEPMYGDATQDQGDEARFYVELTRLDRLNDTFSLDIRRLKGNLRSYKFLYDTLRGCVVFFSPKDWYGWVGRELMVLFFVQARRSSAVKERLAMPARDRRLICPRILLGSRPWTIISSLLLSSPLLLLLAVGRVLFCHSTRVDPYPACRVYPSGPSAGRLFLSFIFVL